MKTFSAVGAFLHRQVAAFLAQPARRYVITGDTDLDLLSAMLRPGDVILTEGNTRFAALVRLLTRSPWTHVAMYVGPACEMADPPCIIEADVAGGVREIRLSDLQGFHVVVARPIGLTDRQRERLVDGLRTRVGHGYDLKNAIDLAQLLLPLPRRLGRCRIPLDTVRPLGSADPKKAICSTLVANAFAMVGLSIAPATVLGLQRTPVERSALDATYLIPHDFAASPHFELIETASRPRDRSAS